MEAPHSPSHRNAPRAASDTTAQGHQAGVGFRQCLGLRVQGVGFAQGIIVIIICLR